MELSEILRSIPSTVANLFSKIYCINIAKGKVLDIGFTGDEIKIESTLTYDDFKKNYNEIVEDIEKEENAKKVINNKLVYINKIEDYKLVYIINLKEKEEKVSDKKSILIADDSPVITKFFTKTLEADYNVLVATNGQEAIDIVNENKDTLYGAFIDLQMPIKNGYEVLDYFKENDLFKSIPVSVISGEDTQNGIEKATNYGIVDMLTKPFNAEAAKSIVNKTISFSSKN